MKEIIKRNNIRTQHFISLAFILDNLLSFVKRNTILFVKKISKFYIMKKLLYCFFLKFKLLELYKGVNKLKNKGFDKSYDRYSYNKKRKK